MSTLSQSSRKTTKEAPSISSFESASIGSSSLISSKNERFKFLRKSPLNRAKRSFINLYSYLFSALPIQTVVCKLMFWLRLTQMFILSFFYPNTKLYVKGSYSYNVGVFMSILTRFFPIGVDIKYQMVLGWIYVAFFIVHILFLSFSAFYFNKKSTLPSFVPNLLSYVFLIVEHLPHCWIMSLDGMISSQKDEITYEKISILVLSLITAIIFFVLHQFLNISSIFFTPTAFKTAYPWPQSALTYTISIICFLAEFSGHYPNKTVSLIMMILVLLLYFFIFFLMVIKARFLNGFQENVFCSVNIGCIANTIISIIFFVLDKEIPEYIFVVVVVYTTLTSFVCTYVHTYVLIKSIRILDMLEESKDNYSMFKKSSNLIPHILVGFQVNHRYCLSYSVFVDSLNYFEDDFKLIVLFGKFLAIYPEEYSQLNWIYAIAQKNDKKNFIRKYIKAQLLTILMRRESSLSNELKKKLQSISNLIVTAKMRIKNIWEASLSGSTAELEPLFISYYSIIKQIDLKFTYLQNYHSNNQYALSSLSGYERDVQANYELSNFHREKARKIRLGHNDGIDQVYLYGRLMFPNLPSRPIFHRMKTSVRPTLNNAIQAGGSISSTNSSNDEEGEILLDDNTLLKQDMQTRLRNSIMNMSVSSLRAGRILTLLMIFFFFVVPYILILVMLNPMEEMISNPIKYLTNLDLVHKMVLHLYGLTLHWIMEDEPLYMPNLCGQLDGSHADFWRQDGGIPENIGGDCRTDKMIFYFSRKAILALDELSDMKKDNSNNDILKEVKNILFNNVSQFMTFQTFTQLEKYENKSLQQNSMDSIFTVLQIAISENRSHYKNSREIANIIFNSFQFETIIKDLTDNLLNYINDHTNRISNIFKILEIVLSISFPIIFLSVSFFLLNWGKSQKAKVYHCFNSLPKTTLSKMIESAESNSLTGGNKQIEKSEKAIELKRQEERAIALFRSGDVKNQASQLLGIVIICFLIILSNLILINYGCQYYINNSNNFVHSSPLLKYISYTYCDGISALLLLTCKVWMDNGLSHPLLTDDFILGFYLLKINYTTDFYKIILYGDVDNEIHSVSRYIDNFSKYEDNFCNFDDVNSSVDHTVYRCFSSDSIYIYFINYMKKIFYTFTALGLPIDVNSSLLSDVWHTNFGHLFPYYMDPLNRELTDSVRHVFTNEKSDIIIASTILFIFALIICFIYVDQLYEQEQKLKQVLLLLLHVPAQEIIESSYIMAIISGDFSSRDDSEVHIDDNAYKSITENYPNGILVLNNVGNVLYMNSKSYEYFKSSKRNSKSKNDNYLNVKIPNEIILNQPNFVLKDHLMSVKYSKVDSNKTLAFLTDLSQIQKLESELEEEIRRKADLISKIMPSILINKFMSSQDNGNDQEQSVSFSVQSVTISIISIGLDKQDENTISFFNEVYNSLVSLLDKKKFQTIESIEIIGDSLMIVGGLFDEVNQSERHAQEIIRFSLDSIDTIKAIKEKFDFSDKKTLCGVASGGPVCGGVIELDVPIFEVCGDVIDLADEMMVLGLPDVIHTTRSVYEFIYGRDFKIKERGEVAIPNFGSVVTYIVSNGT